MAVRFRIKTSAGQELSFATHEMFEDFVRSGDLSPEDLVYDGETGSWSPARTNPTVLDIEYEKEAEAEAAAAKEAEVAARAAQAETGQAAADEDARDEDLDLSLAANPPGPDDDVSESGERGEKEEVETDLGIKVFSITPHRTLFSSKTAVRFLYSTFLVLWIFQLFL